MAPVLTGTLNYRKVNLSGGLAIGEFSSSIIKLFPLGGKKMGGEKREGGGEGGPDGKRNRTRSRNKTRGM